MRPRFLLLPVSLLFLASCLAADSFYKVLGVGKDASDGDLKRAYRKLSKKFHPDVNPDAEAQEKFIEISRAYEVLSDTETRAVYDRHGLEGLKQHETQGRHDPFDVFSRFFGGGGGQQQQRGPGMLTNLEVSLADMYMGRMVEFQIPRRVICTHCHGSGAHTPQDIRGCDHCGGHGVITQRHQVFPGMFTNVQATCPRCQGQRQIITKRCGTCNSEKTIQTQHNLAVHIPAGAPEGFEIVFEGEADEGVDWEAGDVVVRVRSRREPEAGGWWRRESGIGGRVVLGLEEALLGFERNVTHLDGRTITLKRTGTTQPGFVDTIPGEGMPAFHGPHGDMFIEYSVVLPTLSNAAKTRFRGAFHAEHDEL